MLTPSRRVVRAALVALVAAALCPPLATVATAQTFGRNKVQYERFDFRILATPHFDIYYYPEESAAAATAGQFAERWYGRFSQLFHHELTGRQVLVLYANHPDFEQTNVIEGEIDEGTGGVTEGERRRIVLPLASTLADSDHVIGHELVHAFQYDILGLAVEGVPLWFIEGMAEYCSIGPRDVQTMMWLRDAVWHDDLPTVASLDNPKYFPYRYGHAFWAYLAGRYGEDVTARALRALSLGRESRGSAGDAIAAIESITKQSNKAITAEWHAAIRDAVGMSGSGPATGGGRATRAGEGPVVLSDTSEKRGGYYVGPSISPDGRRVAFLSSRERLSIELFVADASSGKVLRKLTKTATDPHFESLEFLDSAGAWDPEGRRLAVATARQGKPVLTIFNVDSGRTEEHPLNTLGEILQPSWSPDGTKVAFAGNAGGYTDLYVLDLTSNRLTQLTSDSFADLQPAWSPDGQHIAFATERFGGSTEPLAAAQMRLALYSIADKSVRAIDTGLDARTLNPQWAPNGDLLFLSDAGGRTQVYRRTAADRVERLTDVGTGVSGITSNSPALSVASRGNAVAYSVFDRNGFEIHIVPNSALVAENPAPDADLAQLPPLDRSRGAVVDDVARSAGQVVSRATFEPKPFQARFGLVDVSQEVGLAASSAFGSYINGGIALTFGDILGNHLLQTGIAANGGLKDIGASVTYLNREQRWHWGVFGEHVPYLSGAVSEGLTEVDNQSVFAQQTDILRQTFTQGGFLVAYPLSRVSRIEFSAAARRISFDREVDTQFFDPVTGTFLGDKTESMPAGDPLMLFDGGAAFVRDTASFGATSPIIGQRVRLDVVPSWGDLTMATVNLDVRQYAMPVRPITFAGRLLHVGRYGRSAVDQRLYPLYLGDTTLVRGYDVNSFAATECSLAFDGRCVEFDRLLGSRMLVFNGEVRAPAVGLFTGRLDYGPVPVELFGFYDAGVAWTQHQDASFRNVANQWVSSAGFGARVNAFGYLIAEFNLARALDRPQQGWMFVFNLRPGF